MHVNKEKNLKARNIAKLVKVNGHTVDRGKLERLEMDPSEIRRMMIAVRGAKISDYRNPKKNLFNRYDTSYKRQKEYEIYQEQLK